MKTLLIPALVAATLCSPAIAGDHKTAKKDIVDTAVEAGSFKTLAAALTSADLIAALKSDGPFTVFAPTDDAFAKLPRGTVETLLKPENKDQLVAILTYHVVAGRVPASDVVNLSGAVTLEGQRIDIAVSDRGVTVDKAMVVTTDIECSNGIIHVIDSVILPADEDLVATAAAAGKFGTLIAAAKAAGLVPALTGDEDLTILAPTDEAFEALPKGTVESLLRPENQEQLVNILTYHVIPGRVYSEQALGEGRFATLQGASVDFEADGRGATVAGAPILATDIDASNGVIHVIGSVIMPPAETAQASSSSSCSSSTTSQWN